MIKSAVYRAWITHAGLELLRQRPKPVVGPVNVRVLVQENNRRDLDGYLKATLDLLVSHKLIDGDRCKTVRHIDLDWSREVQGVCVTISTAVEIGDNSGDNLSGAERMGI